jgi:hypothetical protein
MRPAPDLSREAVNRTMQRCRVVPTAATISVLAAISSDRAVRMFSSLVPLPNTLCSMPSKNALVFAVAFGAFHRALEVEKVEAGRSGAGGHVLDH